MLYTRLLDTSDVTGDYLIPMDTEVKMMWAMHSSSPKLSKEHTIDGSFNGMFKSDGTVGKPIYIDGAIFLATQIAAATSVLAMALF